MNNMVFFVNLKNMFLKLFSCCSNLCLFPFDGETFTTWIIKDSARQELCHQGGMESPRVPNHFGVVTFSHNDSEFYSFLNI